MGVFHLLHHEHQARYDRMFPYLWAYAILLALAGFVMDTPAGILRGLYTIITTEDALITDYVLVAGPGAALVNSAIVTAISICVLYAAGDTLNGMTLVEMGLMSGFSLFGKNFVNIWPILAGTWLYTRARRQPAAGRRGQLRIRGAVSHGQEGVLHAVDLQAAELGAGSGLTGCGPVQFGPVKKKKR